MKYLRQKIGEFENLKIEYSNLYIGKLISENEVVELFESRDHNN